MGWSSLLIVFVTIIVLVDGGVEQPARAVYFLPLVFAALSYPVRSMIAVSVVDVTAYVFAAVAVGGVSSTDGGVRRPRRSSARAGCAPGRRASTSTSAASSAASRAPTRSPAR